MIHHAGETDGTGLFFPQLILQPGLDDSAPDHVPADVRDAPGDVLRAVQLVGDKSHRRVSLAGDPEVKGEAQGREYSSITRPIARRQIGQKPPGSRVNMMQSAEGR